MRPFARFLALVAAVLVVLPAWALPATTYYCRWTERTMSSCCCRGHENPQAEPPAQDELRRAPCCEVIESSSDAAPGTREAPVRVDAAAVVDRVPIQIELAASGRVILPRTAQARAPPGVGPPLFLSHCSLLI